MRTSKSFVPCLTVLLLTLLVHERAMPQDVSITFAATIDGVPVPMDSIWVKDVGSGTDTMLYWPDTVLVLDFSTGIPNVLPPKGAASGLSMSQAVPNPYDGRTQLQVSVEDAGDLTFTVHDAMGRTLARQQRTVGRGTHAFSCTGGPTGVLFVEAQWNGQRTNQRLLNMSGGQPMDLRYAGGESTTGNGHWKAAWDTWQIGDSLLYIVFATGPDGYVFSASGGGTLTGTSTPLLDLLPGVVCAEEPLVADIDGNIYPVVQIGDQCWMATNLRTSRYRDGTTIPNVPDNTEWSQLTSGAWCNYENNPGNDTIYGKLYNSFVANNPNTCPSGWHVPTDVEWQQMEAFLGMPAAELNATGTRGAAQNVGGKLKATILWWGPGTNESGFSGLPGGIRSEADGEFGWLLSNSFWWCAVESGSEILYTRRLSSSAGIDRVEGLGGTYEREGYYLRCLRD